MISLFFHFPNAYILAKKGIGFVNVTRPCDIAFAQNIFLLANELG